MNSRASPFRNVSPPAALSTDQPSESGESRSRRALITMQPSLDGPFGTARPEVEVAESDCVRRRFSCIFFPFFSFFILLSFCILLFFFFAVTVFPDEPPPPGGLTRAGEGDVDGFRRIGGNRGDRKRRGCDGDGRCRFLFVGAGGLFRGRLGAGAGVFRLRGGMLCLGRRAGVLDEDGRGLFRFCVVACLLCCGFGFGFFVVCDCPWLFVLLPLRLPPPPPPKHPNTIVIDTVFSRLPTGRHTMYARLSGRDTHERGRPKTSPLTKYGGRSSVRCHSPLTRMETKRRVVPGTHSIENGRPTERGHM